MPLAEKDISWLLGIPNHDIEEIGDLSDRKGVVVELKRRRTVLKCPCCGRAAPLYDTKVRLVRDLPLWGRGTWLMLWWPRVNCADCGVLTVRYSWVGPSGRRTRRYERWIYELTRWIPVTDVAQVTGLAWNTVKQIEKRYIRGGLRQCNLDGITALGVDEVSYRKGYRYLTILTDLRGRRVIGVEKERDSTALRRFFRRLGPERLKRIREVVRDMHDPYLSVVKDLLPHATIIFDHLPQGRWSLSILTSRK